MELELRGTSKPGGASIRLSEADPELLGDAADRHPLADHDLRLHALPTGRWRPPGTPAPRLGHLIVDGLIARRVAVARQHRAELLGPGELIRPFAGEDELGSTAYTVEWQVVAPARVAVLDDEFLCTAASFPDVLVALTVRGVERARRLGLQMAITELRPIEERLRALFVYLADRWGKVTPQGITLPIRMSHGLVAELVGARRPTVTTALGVLHHAGDVVRTDDGGWLVRRSLAVAAR